MWTRREFLSRGSLAALAAGCGGLAVLGQAAGPDEVEIVREDLPDGSQARGMITDDAERAIQRGLQYLRDHQAENGSFGTNAFRGNIAITSLGALAFMAGGHLPGRGPFGSVVTRALDYILQQEEKGPPFPGYLRSPFDHSHGPMYGHGFGTLFLGEIYGMVNDPALRDKVHGTLKRAVALIVRSQNHQGGWRYRPDTTEADISVTICQIMALRSARNAGVFVPKSTVDKCVQYVQRCQDKREGWFRYRLEDPGIDNQSFARTAAGVAALFSAGIYKGPEVERALAYLVQRYKPGGRGRFPFHPDMYYFYGHYYAAQAMWTAGGNYWTEWFPGIREELIAGQQRERGDGAWQDICPHYGTAMACIILQIPNNYLPILQK